MSKTTIFEEEKRKFPWYYQLKVSKEAKHKIKEESEEGAHG